ncbi:MAG TPA: tRNA dihydrouridine synthase DusB [Oscillospiraceae bacterium]|nr:tRNA dihydrouridine synthase DusB [Oscillospiraceae bacterium]
MRIGKVNLKNKVLLAPMAGVSDSAFRQIAVEMGCALVYTEMVSAKGIICAPAQSLKLAHFTTAERPIAIQLFGSEAKVMAEGAAVCARLKPEIIDINLGCPVKKVVSKGEGCALMRDPSRVFDLVQAVTRAVTPLPVTVKIRKGWDEDSINAVEVALAAQEAGAAAVAVHGRTRTQGYSGRADWAIIRAVKKKLTVPVIGNGDIWQPKDAARMLEQTGCDAVMLARGVLGNPWLIQRTVHYLREGTLLPEPDVAEKVVLALRHLEMQVQIKGEAIGVREMRKHFAWYLKGVRGAASFRNQIMRVETKGEIEQILRSVMV